MQGLGRLVMKSILIILHFHSQKFYSLIQHSLPLVFYFHLLLIWALDNKLWNALLHALRLIYISQVVVHLCGIQMNEYMEIWDSSMILIWSPSTLGTHNLPWYFSTPSPHCSKANALCLWTFAFKSNKMGYWTCFSFTYDISDDSAPLVTTIPTSLESIFVTPKRACVHI